MMILRYSSRRLQENNASGLGGPVRFVQLHFSCISALFGNFICSQMTRVPFFYLLSLIDSEMT